LIAKTREAVFRKTPFMEKPARRNVPLPRTERSDIVPAIRVAAFPCLIQIKKALPGGVYAAGAQ
jgi:hypothetical protein